MARGFTPVGLRSSPKPKCGVPEEMNLQIQGLLRSPTGVNPLTTGV